jgi:glycosyltransferase involved in cell wall biosynthesis
MGKILIIQPALAPYRVDFFNDVAIQLSRVHFFFLMPQMISQPVRLDDFEFKADFTVGVKRVFKKWNPTLISILALPPLIRTLWRVRPDTIVTNEFGFLTFLIVLYCKIMRLRHIAWTDDSLDNTLQCGWFRKLRRGFILRFSDHFMVCNPSVRDYFQACLPYQVESVEILQKELVFRHGLRRSVPVANGYIERYHLQGRKVVLFVGRLAEVKNLPALITAFANVHDERAVLVLAGSGMLEKALRALVAKHNISDRVIFAGYQRAESLWAWYLIGGLFVLPSIFEPFGAVVNEALLAGMPVLCSKYAGASCLVKDDSNGTVFDPGDVEYFERTLFRWVEKIPPVASRAVVHDSLMQHDYKAAVSKFVAVCSHC